MNTLVRQPRLRGFVRNERALRGTKALRVLEQAVKRIALDVEFGVAVLAQDVCKIFDVDGTNVPLVRTRVHGDPLRARRKTNTRAMHDARHADAPRVPQRRDLVHSDRKLRHGSPRERSNQLRGVGNAICAPSEAYSST